MRNYPDVSVSFVADCPVLGAYFPPDMIVIAKGQTRVMRRSVLAEELAHHCLGHRPHRSVSWVGKMEAQARKWAATRLISLEDLAHALVGARSWFEVAEDLDIDPELLAVRMKSLTEAERGELLCLVGRAELDL